MVLDAPLSAGKGWSRFALGAALGVALAVLGKAVHDRELYSAGSDFGYYLGLAGGLLMLTLLLYPLRKRQLLFGERCGPMQHWFRFHVFAGICGPLLVLFHSTFRIGSLNAAAALYAMLLVVFSGVVGRFIYRHVSVGLHGRHLELAELTRELEAAADGLGAVYALCPECERQLRAFRAHALAREASLAARVLKFVGLRRQGLRLARRLLAEARQAVLRRQAVSGAEGAVAALSLQLAQARIERYVQLVVAVSQLAGWERLFSLWHVVHVPFLYLLAFSGIVHVVAVHMY
jgi:hypothetical protein